MAKGRANQSQRAERALRSMILNGELEAGGRISEIAVSEKLGLSRTPIREAVARLVEEGLIETLASGRSKVASYTGQDITDAIEVRGTFEGVAARLAAERGVDAEAEHACRVILDAIDDALTAADGIDFESYAALNAEFHVWLREAARSPIIARELTRATRLPLADPSAFLQGQEINAKFLASLRIAQSQHRAILDAIVNREGARAEAMAREHARLARQNLASALADKNRTAPRSPGLVLVAND